MLASSSHCIRRACTSVASQSFQRCRPVSPLAKLAHSWAIDATRPSLSRLAGPTLGTTMHSRIFYRSLSSSCRNSSQPPPPSSASSPTPTGASKRMSTLNEEFQRHQRETYRKRNQSLFMYSAATVMFFVGFTYAAVPLYRAFCSATGFSGTPTTDPARFESSRLVPAYFNPATNVPSKRIRVTFNADASDAIPWSFSPQQKEIHILPGETALAFYTATNKSDKDIIGIATYNVSPDRIAPYFAKVECFCFEEQKLLAGEEVDLPVFFFIDTDALDDPAVKDVTDVVLSYTFFSARRNAKNGQLEPDTDLSQYTVGKDL